MKEFDARIELYLGEEGVKKIIDCTAFVWIPRGLVHGPLKITRVNKPFLFVDIVLGPRPDYRRKPQNTRV